ncbi:hypothetical protein AWB68_07981 [Caballeronia choica]|uniref:Transposase n=1 Tax=Caballeronia choica TaxID=326476 RepID=A0A158KYV7_9BURK|nr:hypothetical protein AWB68_07981 [Caballeronia choica]
MMDGKLILVTNVPDLAPADVVARYKALADIERGFRQHTASGLSTLSAAQKELFDALNLPTPTAAV